MKIKMFVFVVILSLIGTYCFAAPFVICKEDSTHSSYLIKFNNNEIVEQAAPLHYDLDGIAKGQHVVEVTAKNFWGVSNPIPFEFLKELPNDPSNIGLSER